MSSIDATTIHDSLERDVAARMDQLEVFDEIDSTNSYLLRQQAPGPGRHRVAVAGHQTAGRGRQSREWISAPGSSLCLSVAYTFGGQPENLPGLTLAIGVAARDALTVVGVDDVLLKWPNDLVANDGKLAGMLAETHIRSDADTTVVAGIGVNIDLPKQLLRDNPSRWSHRAADLSAVSGSTPSRELLAAVLVNHLVESIDPLQNKTVLTYNTLGQVLTATNPLEDTTTYTYDASGKPAGQAGQRVHAMKAIAMLCWAAAVAVNAPPAAAEPRAC